MKIIVIYAYHETNANYRDYFEFFLENGICEELDYLIVVNGTCSLDLTKYPVKVIYRENEGFDFGAWNHGVYSLDQKYDYYIFLNATVCGPFIPNYVKNTFKWYMAFINLIKDDVKLVGPTINTQSLNYSLLGPHVQSYCFSMDSECFEFLKKSNFFKRKYHKKDDVVLYQEVGLSTLVLKNGWNISCLIPEYQGIDYRKEIIPMTQSNGSGNITYYKNYFGRYVHPYEVIFIKLHLSDIHLPIKYSYAL